MNQKTDANDTVDQRRAEAAAAAAAGEGGEGGEAGLVDLVTNNRAFGLRMADTVEGRNKASLLINRMYAWRGYAGSHTLAEDPNRITLTATDKGDAVGTLTLGIDSPLGLLADEIFRDEIAPYRQPGRKLCEITKFAFDPRVRSKEPMAALFHLSTLMARDIHGCTDLFIEVNPRHRAFYENKLGFTSLGEPKTNPRVNAPAYLLWLSYAYVTEQINRYGGNPHAAGGNRSFYPLFYSPREEKGLIARLRENR